MTGQRWLIAGILASLMAGSGCVSCGSKGFGLARDAGPTCDLPECQRNQMYIFAVGGLNPAGAMALDSLRLKLNEQGFAKVASGQTIHTWWMTREMRRIHAEEPEAVFVIVGAESGGSSAAKLAEKALTEGLPVGAVVLLDAEGRTPASPPGVRTLTVGGFGGATTAGTESVVVPDVGRYGLLTDPRTIEAVARVLNEVAATIPLPATQVVAEWSYPHAPEMRPLVEMNTNPEWAFLFDEPGGATRAITDPLPIFATKPTAGTQTSARRPEWKP